MEQNKGSRKYPARYVSWKMPSLIFCGLLLVLFLASPARAQLTNDEPVVTEGTEFITDPPTPPKQPEAPQNPQVNQPVVPLPLAPKPPKSSGPPPRYPSVVFLLDTSDSMLNPVLGTSHTRLDEAKSALGRVIQGMSSVTRVQVWSFNTKLRPLAVDAASKNGFYRLGNPGLRQRLATRINRASTGGGTNFYRALLKSFKIFANPEDQRAYKSGQRYPVMVIISDGEDMGKTPENLKMVLEERKKYPLVSIQVIGFHTGGKDTLWLKKLCQIATDPQGCATAGNEGQLKTILESFYKFKGR